MPAWRGYGVKRPLRCGAATGRGAPSPRPVSRRNWLFARSRVGGERAAAICTVIETCKMNGVDPQAYIADVIAKIAADRPPSRWDEVMP